MSTKEDYNLFGLNKNAPYTNANEFGQSLERYSLNKSYFVRYSLSTKDEKGSDVIIHKQAIGTAT